MLETNFQKIDKYFVSLVIVLMLMATLLVFSFKGVFSAFVLAGSIDPSSIESQQRINQSDINNAYSWAFNKNPEKLKF